MTNLSGLSDLLPADRTLENDNIDNDTIGGSTIVSSLDNSDNLGTVKDSKDVKADKQKSLAEGWEAWVAGIKARMSKDVNDGISEWIDNSIKATKEHIRKLGTKQTPVEKPAITAKGQSQESKVTSKTENKQGSSKTQSKEKE